MWNVFQGSDIVRFAMALEENGARFYQALLEKVREPAVQAVLKDLAAEEQVHYQRYQELLKGLDQLNPAETYPGEYLDYVQSLVDANVFATVTDPETLAAGLKDTAQALQMAIRLEKDSMLFFYELRNVVPKQHYDAVNNLISEEHRHVVRLSRLLAQKDQA